MEPASTPTALDSCPDGSLIAPAAKSPPILGLALIVSSNTEPALILARPLVRPNLKALAATPPVKASKARPPAIEACSLPVFSKI